MRHEDARTAAEGAAEPSGADRLSQRPAPRLAPCRHLNGQCVQPDRALWLLSCTVFLPSIMLKIWLVEGLGGEPAPAAVALCLQQLASAFVYPRGPDGPHRCEPRRASPFVCAVPTVQAWRCSACRTWRGWRPWHCWRPRGALCTATTAKSSPPPRCSAATAWFETLVSATCAGSLCPPVQRCWQRAAFSPAVWQPPRHASALCSCPPSAKNGGTNFFLLHCDSPWVLAGLMLLCGHALWCSVCSIYHRWPPALARIALPAAAFLPVSGSLGQAA